ncbi:COX15/CtaA family protein [Ascidiimonas sp. W6]|uniref:COX15/CtaA family protein n=1 Tax=Ascidiimonas meishanensis TaxID=3128903 RepID=UPI0030EF6E7E
MKNNFQNIAKTALILIYLVIVAGAVVRMTGSGMGCPDWPKCFGYLIPPTERAQLEWQEGRAYEEGQVIIYNENLKVASKDFTTGSTYEESNWKPYIKHDYAVFNAFHTWTEFINRLIGALAGLATLLMAIASFGYWRKNKKITLLSWTVVFGMVFQAWLGAKVVYSVLQPVKITIHMVAALVLVALVLYIISSSRELKKGFVYNSKFYAGLWLALLLTMLQVILGTQVRQFVDDQIDQVGELAKNLWLQDPNVQFYIHRSFSIVVLALNVLLFFQYKKLKLGYHKMNWVLLLLLSEILTGILMYYVDFPFLSQPLHLVIASLLFGVQFYLVLEALEAKKQRETL